MAERYQPLTPQGASYLAEKELEQLRALRENEALDRGELTDSLRQAYERMFGTSTGATGAQMIQRMREPSVAGKLAGEAAAQRQLASRGFQSSYQRAMGIMPNTYESKKMQSRLSMI